jgi:hypothetical protein
MWKPDISVSTVSLGNSGVIDTHNSFDQLEPEATDSGWEYLPCELAGSGKLPKRRRWCRNAPTASAPALFAVHLAFVLWFVPTGRLLSSRSRVAHRCDGQQQSIVSS